MSDYVIDVRDAQIAELKAALKEERNRVGTGDLYIAELTAERDMLAKALEIALVDQRRLSGMYSYRGDDDSESRCDKRIKYTEEVLSRVAQKQAPTAQEVREGLG